MRFVLACGGVLFALALATLPIAAAGDEAAELAKLASEYERAEVEGVPNLLVWAARFQAIGSKEADARAEVLYRKALESEPDQPVARRQLGYVDFQADILGRVLEAAEDPVPEIVTNRRGYPFIDAFLHFFEKRWLHAGQEVRLAAQAASALADHARRLAEEPLYRAGAQLRANIASDPQLRDLNYESVWAPPYLICYSSSETLSEHDLLKEPDRRKRLEKMVELRKKRDVYRAVLEQKAKIFTQLYRDFLGRYGEKQGLADLAKPYGGRPDYKAGIRSFPDGIPLLVWIFEDEKAFRRYHQEIRGEVLPKHLRGGYFNPARGWVMLYDFAATPAEQELEVRTALRKGGFQLLHWFTRQKSAWRRPPPSQNFFGHGLAAYLSAVRIGPEHQLDFTGVNEGLRGDARKMAARLEEMDRAYPVFPLERLVSFSSYGGIREWGAGEWGLPPDVVTLLFRQQSWALVSFLQNAEHGRYARGFDRLFDAVLRRETGSGGMKRAFAEIFALTDPPDWKGLGEAFRDSLGESLLGGEPTSASDIVPAQDG